MLWFGQTVSAIGSEVTDVALPLLAVLVLGAGPVELGMVNASRWAPYLLVGLLIGVYVDRLRRRALMIGADVGRLAILVVIVVTAWTGTLNVGVFIVMSCAFGTLTVIFEVSYQSYLPSLVDEERLMGANSRLQASASVARVGGPGLGGYLVGLLGAPLALVADGISFVASLWGLSLIRARESVPHPTDAEEGLVHRIGAGLRITYRNRALRSLAGLAATYNFFDDWIMTLFMLYAVHQLGLSAGVIGTILMAGAVGATLGSLSVQWSTHTVGIGRTLLWSVLAESIVLLAVPLVPANQWYTVPIVAGAFFVNGTGVAASSVTAVTVRQAVTPTELMGRITASYRFVAYGAVPLGAFAGGVVGEVMGVHLGLAAGTIGLVGTVLWVVCSPALSVRTMCDLEAIGTDDR